jgi:hypothetical protein
MDGERQREVAEPAASRPTGYAPPRVERVVTPAELEREILYAGSAPSLT